jgi:hypothetical protein
MILPLILLPSREMILFSSAFTSRPNVFTSIQEGLFVLMANTDHKFKSLVCNKTEM